MSSIKIYTTEELNKGGKNEIAKIILEQLGAAHFVVMTGSDKFTVIEGEDNLGGLMFAIKTNKSKANRCYISLTAADDYSVEFVSEWFDKAKNQLIKNVKARREGLFFNELKGYFTEVTGFELQIPVIAESFNKYEEIGRNAFLNGLERKPIYDEAFKNIINEVCPGFTSEDARKRMDIACFWFDGYDKARNKALENELV